MNNDNTQMTLSLDVKQRLINLGVTFTPGASLSKTIRREAKRRYLASLDSKQLQAAGFREWPPLIQNGDNTFRDATAVEMDDILDNFRMSKDVHAISEPMFTEVRGLSKEAIQSQIEHGYTVEATRVNAKGWTYYVSKPPTTADTLRSRRMGAINITAEVLSSLPAGPAKDEIFKRLADAKVDLVAIKAKADAKAKKEAEEFLLKQRADMAEQSRAKVLAQAKQQVEQDKLNRLQK